MSESNSKPTQNPAIVGRGVFLLEILMRGAEGADFGAYDAQEVAGAPHDERSARRRDAVHAATVAADGGKSVPLTTSLVLRHLEDTELCVVLIFHMHALVVIHKMTLSQSLNYIVFMKDDASVKPMICWAECASSRGT